MALNADWMVPVGLGILGSLIAVIYRALKPHPIPIRNPRRKR